MRSKFILLMTVITVSLLFSGCNIFSWSNSESAESLIDEGNAHMRDAEYDQAVASFARAMEMEPDNSEARYYHAKAFVHASGFNSLALTQIMSDGEFIESDQFPFTGGEWPKGRANELYQVAGTIFSDLRPIFDKETTGSFDSSDIDLDLGLAAGMRGILMFQDTNLDGQINDDDFDWIIEYLSGLNRGFELSNFHNFITQNQPGGKILALSPEVIVPIDPAVIIAVNLFIDNIVELIDLAYSIIMSIAVNNFGFDPADVAEVLEEIKATANMYHIADGLDNDGDGSIDEEVVDGIDNDGDGIIDEDSNGTVDI